MNIKKNKKNYELLKVLNEIKNAKYELQVANDNFETAENELIDYYAYQIKAIKAKLDYLIRFVKKSNITGDITDQMKLEKINVI